MKMHEVYGGVVPALASREHLVNLPVMLEVLKQEHDLSEVSEVVATHGPGLAGCLALGVALGQSIAMALDVPLYGINHLLGHVGSPFMGSSREAEDLFPHLGLVVSGGNTLLVGIDEERNIEVLGQTVDDAAGEALDKGGKLLGLGYPAGPLIEKKAKEGDAKAYDFPVAFRETRDLKFSFSGLKTSLRYTMEGMSDEELDEQMGDLCASYQEAVVGALELKVGQALRGGKYRSLGISGGVAANGHLRERMQRVSEREKVELLVADREYSGDNAAMIAFAADFFPKEKSAEVRVNPSLRL